jgi:hypothetical protein
MQEFLEALKRDAWKLVPCVCARVFGLYHGRGMIVFLARAA